MCVILFAILQGVLSSDTRVVFTTPGSYLHLNTSQFEPSIYFEVFRKSKWGLLVNTSEEYDKKKYEIIRSKVFTLTIKAPEVPGMFVLNLTDKNLVSEREFIDLILKSDDMVYGNFTYSSIEVGYFDFLLYKGSLSFWYEFQLKIHGDIGLSIVDRYRCRLSLKQIKLAISNLKFLKQTDDNIMYSKEGESIILACTTITNHDVEELSIQQNGIVLAKSNRSIVTFSFTPDRYDSFKNYKCVGKESQWADVVINLVINYAPDVDVVVREQRIDCVPHGYPKTYIFGKWEHQSEQGIHIRYLDGLQNGTLDLQPLSQQYHLSGIYVCSVSNGIPDLNGIVFQKGYGNLSYSGAPSFVTENRKVKLVVPGEHFTMSFLIYSNPIVDKIWIGTVGTDLTKAIRMNFGISKADLIQSATRENYMISGYTIIIETDIFRSNDVHEYIIWADNTLGVDSYQFQILIDENSNHCFNEDKIQIIASGSIATVIIIYLFISHVCFCVRMRKKRTMQSNIQEPLNNHAYDEIGPITNQEGNEHLLTTGHQELNQQIGELQYPQDESATTNRNSPDQMHDNMDNTDISSTVSEQERSSNELHHGNPSELHDNRSTVLHDVTTYNDQISGDESATSTDQDGVSKTSSTGNDQDSNITSTQSTSSDESSGSILGCVGISDGYEHPYQSMMPANQEVHQYCDLTNIP